MATQFVYAALICACRASTWRRMAALLLHGSTSTREGECMLPVLLWPTQTVFTLLHALCWQRTCGNCTGIATCKRSAHSCCVSARCMVCHRLYSALLRAPTHVLTLMQRRQQRYRLCMPAAVVCVRYAEAESRYGPKPNVHAAVAAYAQLAHQHGMSPTAMALR